MARSEHGEAVVLVRYRQHIHLRIALSATDLVPARQTPRSKLTLASVTDLVTLAKPYEELCPSHPKRSGSDYRPRTKTPLPKASS